jgi:hypothetical protein
MESDEAVKPLLFLKEIGGALYLVVEERGTRASVRLKANFKHLPPQEQYEVAQKACLKAVVKLRSSEHGHS